MERMSLDVNKMTKDQLRQHILMLAMQLTQLEQENKKLKEKLQWWKDLVQKAKEFEYDEDGMDYIWQNTKNL